MGSGVFKNTALGKFPKSVLVCEGPLRGEIVPRRRSEFRMQVSRDIGDRRLNLVYDIGRSCASLFLTSSDALAMSC